MIVPVPYTFLRVFVVKAWHPKKRSGSGFIFCKVNQMNRSVPKNLEQKGWKTKKNFLAISQ
jgi:hypothetical protein